MLFLLLSLSYIKQCKICQKPEILGKLIKLQVLRLDKKNTKPKRSKRKGKSAHSNQIYQNLKNKKDLAVKDQMYHRKIISLINFIMIL